VSDSFFKNNERRAKLLYVAGLWKETPWCANSSAQGKRAGVSCHNLPREIYISCGALRNDFPKITGTPNAANELNLIEPFLDSRPEFVRLQEGEPIFPGDLMGLWLALDAYGHRVRHRHTNHLAVILDEYWFVHVLMHKNTDFDLQNVSPWLERRLVVWRPLEL
jgi:hypothetical protein